MTPSRTSTTWSVLFAQQSNCAREFFCCNAKRVELARKTHTSKTRAEISVLGLGSGGGGIWRRLHRQIRARGQARQSPHCTCALATHMERSTACGAVRISSDHGGEERGQKLPLTCALGLLGRSGRRASCPKPEHVRENGSGCFTFITWLWASWKESHNSHSVIINPKRVIWKRKQREKNATGCIIQV